MIAHNSEIIRLLLEDGLVDDDPRAASQHKRFPANFMLIAAMNPCPCGYRGDSRRECHCNIPAVERYMGKISGPLLDRIDIHIEVPAVPFKDLAAAQSGTTSGEMRRTVMNTRAIQAKRFAGTTTQQCPDVESDDSPTLQAGRCASLLHSIKSSFGLCRPVAHDKILRVARTIADMEGRKHQISKCRRDFNEADNYRMLDRNMWK